MTCPDALERLRRDAGWLDLDIGAFDIPGIDDDEETSPAIVPNGSTPGDLFLEEYRFETEARDLDPLITMLTGLMQRDGAKDALTRQLVIVSNDSFAHLVQHATPVNAHIAIDARTKTVTGGALWYEETLPPETLLYTCLSANAARKEKAELEAGHILALVLDLFEAHPWLQLGGNETVGMGWCAVTARTFDATRDDTPKQEA